MHIVATIMSSKNKLKTFCIVIALFVMRVRPGDPVTILRLRRRVTGGAKLFQTFPDFAINSLSLSELASDSSPMAMSLSSEFNLRLCSDFDASTCGIKLSSDSLTTSSGSLLVNFIDF